MKRTKPKHSVRAAQRATGQTPTDLSTLDGCKVAVMLPAAGPQKVLVRGSAVFQVDDVLDRIVRIRIDGEEALGSPEMIVQESTWNGRVIPDVKHGCDYCLIPSAQ